MSINFCSFSPSHQPTNPTPEIYEDKDKRHKVHEQGAHVNAVPTRTNSNPTNSNPTN